MIALEAPATLEKPQPSSNPMNALLTVLTRPITRQSLQELPQARFQNGRARDRPRASSPRNRPCAHKRPGTTATTFGRCRDGRLRRACTSNFPSHQSPHVSILTPPANPRRHPGATLPPTNRSNATSHTLTRRTSFRANSSYSASLVSKLAAATRPSTHTAYSAR